MNIGLVPPEFRGDGRAFEVRRWGRPLPVGNQRSSKRRTNACAPAKLTDTHHMSTINNECNPNSTSSILSFLCAAKKELRGVGCGGRCAGDVLDICHRR